MNKQLKMKLPALKTLQRQTGLTQNKRYGGGRGRKRAKKKH